MKLVNLTRHAHAASNAADVVSCLPPGEGLSELGREQALALHHALAAEPVALGVSTELLRTQQTLEIALGGRDVPTLVLPDLNEIHFGGFEGGPLTAYRAWAWASEPDAECPGGGESRASAAVRFAHGLETLLARPEPSMLVVMHALPLRYVLDASDGSFPAARIERVEHAVPYRLARDRVELAAKTLRAWAEAPTFTDTPFGG